MIKSSLSTAIARKLYNYEEFITVAKEVENTVKSCPLTYQGTDTQDIPLSHSQLACRVGARFDPHASSSAI